MFVLPFSHCAVEHKMQHIVSFWRLGKIWKFNILVAVARAKRKDGSKSVGTSLLPFLLFHPFSRAACLQRLFDYAGSLPWHEMPLGLLAGSELIIERSTNEILIKFWKFASKGFNYNMANSY